MDKKNENCTQKQNMNCKYNTRIIDGITECCGYDFGIDGYFNKKIRFCPICGKEIIEKN